MLLMMVSTHKFFPLLSVHKETNGIVLLRDDSSSAFFFGRGLLLLPPSLVSLTQGRDCPHPEDGPGRDPRFRDKRGLEAVTAVSRLSGWSAGSPQTLNFEPKTSLKLNTPLSGNSAFFVRSSSKYSVSGLSYNEIEYHYVSTKPFTQPLCSAKRPYTKFTHC
jgi:hypothetical protein